MTSENPVHPASTEAPISPELAAQVQSDTQDNPVATEGQPDNSEAGTEPTTPDEAKTTPEQTAGEGDGQTPPAKESGTTTPSDPAQETWEVAGKVYKTFEEASAAIRKVAGDNARMAGEIKKLDELKAERDAAKAQAEEAVAANQEWARYFEQKSRGENPPEPESAQAKTVEQAVEQVLAMREQKKSDAELAAQYQTELTELPNNSDYEKVYPVMMELAEKLGPNLRKISPKMLYKMARAVQDEQPQGSAPQGDDKSGETTEPVNKVVKKTEERVHAQHAASKIVGGNKRSSSAKPEPEISPELAAYMQGHGG